MNKTYLKTLSLVVGSFN